MSLRHIFWLVFIASSFLALYFILKLNNREVQIIDNALSIQDIKQVITKRQDSLNEKLNVVATTTLSGFTYKPISKDECSKRPGQDGDACRDYLLADNALQKNDPIICNQVISNDVQNYCVQRFLMDATSSDICDLVRTEFGREVCYKNFARNNNDESACKKNVLGEYDQKECLGSFMASQASATGDINECEKIDILEYRGLCFERIISTLSNDCRRLKLEKHQLECQDRLLYSQALDFNNPKACDLINEKKRKQVCQNVLTVDRMIDSDNDGISDNKELWFTTDPFVSDTDGDKLLDGEEMNKYHTDPTKPDSDSDGINDGEEIAKGTNPKGVGPYVDSESDYDSDGLNNFQENKYGTNQQKKDTDGDGYGDGEEVLRGYNPCGEGKMLSPSIIAENCAKYK